MRRPEDVTARAKTGDGPQAVALPFRPGGVATLDCCDRVAAAGNLGLRTRPCQLWRWDICSLRTAIFSILFGSWVRAVTEGADRCRLLHGAKR